jgi:Domain of unknown function (DUF4192)
MSLPLPADDSAPVPSTPGPAEEQDVPTLRASGPGEVLQLVPYLLGFHPEESVVLMALRGRRIMVSARYDLEAPPEMAVPWMVAAAREAATSVLVVVYSEAVDGPPLAHRQHADRLAELAVDRDLTVTDRLAVAADRWWSYDCADPRCCPPEGTPVDRAGAAAVGAVAEGLVSLAQRSDLEAELAPLPVRVAEVSGALDRADQEVPSGLSREELRARDWATVQRFVQESERRQGPVRTEDAAVVLWALLDVHVRDATLGYLVDRPKPQVTQTWRELVRVAPPLWRAPVATLYAFWCYAAGDGARTNVGIEVALAADPDYSMAHLLDQLVRSGVNPLRFLPDLVEECRSIARRIERRRPPGSRPRRRADE